MSGWLDGLLGAIGVDPQAVPAGLLGPVGTSRASLLSNQSPDVSPLARGGLLSNEQRIGNMWRIATGQARGPLTERDLPAAQAAGNAAVDEALGWAGMTTPVRAYHASPHAFDRFDIKKAGSTTDEGELGRALYFTTDGGTAVSPPFAGPGTKMPHRYEVDLAVKSPLEVEFPKWSADKKKLVRDKIGLPHTATAEEVTAKLRAMGHDSVALDYSPVQYPAKEYAVFDDSLIEILRRYGLLGMVGGGAAAAAGVPE